MHLRNIETWELDFLSRPFVTPYYKLSARAEKLELDVHTNLLVSDTGHQQASFQLHEF